MSNDDAPGACGRSQFVYSAAALDSLDLTPPKAIVTAPVRVFTATRNIFHGPPGAWKTWTALFVAVIAAIAGHRVVILAGEGVLYTVRRRVRQICAGAKTSLKALGDHLLLAVGGYDILSDSERSHAVERALLERRPDVVILDPFVKYFTGDENSAADVGRFTAALDVLAEQGTAVILVHHDRKTSGGHPDMRGSSVLRGWADEVIAFEPSKDAPGAVAVLNTKTRDTEPSAPRVLTYAVTDTTITFAATTMVVSSAGAQAGERITAHLEVHGASAIQDIKAALHISGAAVTHALAVLRAAGTVRDVKMRKTDSRGRQRMVSGVALMTTKDTPSRRASPRQRGPG